MRDEDDQLYIYELYGISTPRLIKATKELRAKIGPTAKITPDQILEAQEFINHSGLDYSGIAMGCLRTLETVIEGLKATSYNRDAEYGRVITPIMQIKGQAGMFGNGLATEISAMVLQFLEKFRRLDDYVLRILVIYIQTVRASYQLKLYSLQTPGASDIVAELAQALKRYEARFKKQIEKD